jgi:hypothetical protein
MLKPTKELKPFPVIEEKSFEEGFSQKSYEQKAFVYGQTVR